VPSKSATKKAAQQRAYYARHRDERIAYSRRYRLAHDTPERRAAAVARSKAWRRANYLKDLFHHARGRALRRGIKFEITFDDLTWPEFCPVLGVRIDYSPDGKEGAPRANGPSLDRSHPKRGYVKGNVRVISYRANHIKTDATAKELALVAAYVAGL
jgi:hypothetical protein